MLETKYLSSGVHVATITVGGAVAPNTRFDPDDIADEYWRVHIQPAGSWQREVLLDDRADSV